MAQLGNFNPDTVKDEYELIPDHTCTAQVIASDLQAKENGTTLKLTYELLDGPHQRRRASEFLNIQHSNSQAQEIAQVALKRLCKAVGHQGVLQDSEALHFKPFTLSIGQRPGKNGYGPSQSFRYAALAGAAPQGGYQPPPPQQQGYGQSSGGQAAAGSRPWNRSAA